MMCRSIDPAKSIWRGPRQGASEEQFDTWREMNCEPLHRVAGRALGLSSSVGRTVWSQKKIPPGKLGILFRSVSQKVTLQAAL